MATFNVQKITQTSGTVNYGKDEINYDLVLMFDVASPIEEITVDFPNNPLELQAFGITTRADITSLIMPSQYYPVSGSQDSMAAGQFLYWFYSSECNRWLRCSS